MFNLEKAIRAWKKDLAKSPNLEDSYLSEIETVLRDEVADLVRQGQTEEAAFRISTGGMGESWEIGSEFSKVRLRRSWGRRLVRWIVPDLLGNYIRISLRKIRRQKGYSAINILGLAVGMAGSLLIFLYAKYERSYDRYHAQADSIYRIVERSTRDVGAGTEESFSAPSIFVETLRKEVPEVVSIARILKWGTKVASIQGRTFVEKRFFFADPEFLRIFTYPLLLGDPRTALSKPFSVVLTKRTAEKYFGRENPVGRTVTIDGNQEYQVMGVLDDVPSNSHFTFDLLASFDTLETVWKNRKNWKTNWHDNLFKTYLQFPVGYDPRVFEEKLRRYSFKGWSGETWTFHVQPLTDIHLRGHVDGELEANGDIKYLYIFGSIAAFLMIIACSNFVNLSTARSSVRAKEVGVRKVVGAGRFQLVGQFLGESLLLAGVALAAAVLMVGLVLPTFRRLVGSDIPLRILREPSSLLWAAVFTVGIGLIAGLYPAFVLSAFQPVKTLKGNRSAGSASSASFRGLLVIVQFVISAALITGSLVVRGQLDFLRAKKLGYQKDHVLTLYMHNDPGLEKNFETVMRDLQSRPRISAVSVATAWPNDIAWSTLAEWRGKSPEEKPFFYRLGVDREFLDLYGFEIVRGRAFPKTPGEGENAVYIVNETATKRMGLENPIGHPVAFDKIPGTIIGVVKDFHFAPMTQPIAPLAISVMPMDQLNRISVKVNSADIPGALDDIRTVWKKYATLFPFQYAFLDKTLDAIYKREQNLAEGFGYFTLIAIFIAGLGLFGLASYSAERRTKEIGIRKVLGAGMLQVMALLTRDFGRWIAVATLLAAPVAYFAMNAWLGTFAYRISVPLSAFIISTGLILAASALTVSCQLIKAATADPATILRQD